MLASYSRGRLEVLALPIGSGLSVIPPALTLLNPCIYLKTVCKVKMCTKCAQKNIFWIFVGDAVRRTLPFLPIRFSTVHEQVSVNINHFYQGSQCVEWLAKRMCWKTLMETNKAKVKRMQCFIFVLSPPPPPILGLKSVSSFAVFLCFSYASCVSRCNLLLKQERRWSPPQCWKSLFTPSNCQVLRGSLSKELQVNLHQKGVLGVG